MKKIRVQLYDLNTDKWQKQVSYELDTGTVGISGHKIGGIRLDIPYMKHFRIYQKGDISWSKRNYNGNKKRAVIGVAIKDRKIAYRVHLVTGKWLPVVYGKKYNLDDFQNGFAGDLKHAIDMIEIWRVDYMANFPAPFNPVGSNDPCWMTNLYGASWTSNWNTCIFGSPQQSGANVLSNCTGYAQGRALYIYNYIYNYDPAQTHTHPFSTLNGQPDSWITRATAAGLTVSNNPRAGSILVTNDHVAVVEKYVEDEGWWISESGYGNTVPYHYWYEIAPGVKDLYKDNDGDWCSAYSSPSKKIQGFILIPGATPGPGPTPGPRRVGYDRRRRYRNV